MMEPTVLKVTTCITFQISSVQLCLTLCNPMNRSTPGLPVHHQLPEFTETHVHRVSDFIQPSYPLSSPSPPAPNPSQHQSLFQWGEILSQYFSTCNVSNRSWKTSPLRGSPSTLLHPGATEAGMEPPATCFLQGNSSNLRNWSSCQRSLKPLNKCIIHTSSTHFQMYVDASIILSSSLINVYAIPISFLTLCGFSDKGPYEGN